jgi:hypothetical protein
VDQHGAGLGLSHPDHHHAQLAGDLGQRRVGGRQGALVEGRRRQVERGAGSQRQVAADPVAGELVVLAAQRQPGVEAGLQVGAEQDAGPGEARSSASASSLRGSGV